MKRVPSSALVFAAALGALVPGEALAQVNEGFALDRFQPSERGSDWFSQESLDLRGSPRVALGAVLSWAHKPLVVYDDAGDELYVPLRHQTYLHVGAALNLWDRLRLGANLPVLVYQRSRRTSVNGEVLDIPEGAGVGDLRVSADLRLVGEYGDPATLALGVQVFAPTGSADSFSSDGGVRAQPRLALAGVVSAFEYAVQAGVHIRGQGENFGGHAFGNEMLFGAAAGFRVADGMLLIGPEAYGTTVVSDGGDGFFDAQSTPFEALLGAHVDLGDIRFGAGVGPGLSRGLGSPQLRTVASLEWFPEVEKTPPPPPPPPPDSDGDGINDEEDACIHEPGPASTDPGMHGGPVPEPDTDKDGIIDKEDACVKEPGERNKDKEKHGCPPDSDNDGIWDRDDACVKEPGVPSDDKTKHGCPLPKDRDGDGILDEDDACPKVKGAQSKDPAKHGCPKAKIVGEEVKILERIEFDTGKATVRAESEEILRAVFDILNEHAEIALLSVEGHTDNRGRIRMNRDLSQRRAAAVVTWLVERGIEPARLASKGFGPDEPIDSNDTELGRQNNRRVEFHIVKRDKSKARVVDIDTEQ